MRTSESSREMCQNPGGDTLYVFADGICPPVRVSISPLSFLAPDLTGGPFFPMPVPTVKFCKSEVDFKRL